jgi:hypothetical protein
LESVVAIGRQSVLFARESVPGQGTGRRMARQAFVWRLVEAYQERLPSLTKRCSSDNVVDSIT